MAKAVFHQGQRVYVKSIGTWSHVEKIMPTWAKDLEEPIRITYDVGFGRPFSAAELVSETVMQDGIDTAPTDMDCEIWRIQRQANRQLGKTESKHHPHPGTYPVVRTDEEDWGGWRVPASEYERNPQRIEHQARMIVHTPEMMRVLRDFTDIGLTYQDDLPDAVTPLLKRAAIILRQIYKLESDAAGVATAAE